MSEKLFVSPIAIDLGGKNTGVYLSHHSKDELPNPTNAEGLLVRIPDKGIVFSQVNRTAKRHQARGYKRKKMAKRLLFLICRVRFNSDPLTWDYKQRDFLLGLMNRRGFTFLSEEIDSEALGKLEPALLNQLIDSGIYQFDEGESLSEQLSKLSTDLDIIDKILHIKYFSSKKKEREKHFENHEVFLDLDKVEKKERFKEIGSFVDMLEAIKRSEKDGHKPRKEYFANIRQDIESQPLGKAILSSLKISADQLANLIGNISNLQLRVLRKYFNDKTMSQGKDHLDTDRLVQKFTRYIKAWHPKKDEEKRNQKQILNKLKPNADIVQYWLDTNPELTIPPYEDQNNRRPPKCQTLLLRESVVSSYLPGWEKVVEQFEQREAQWFEDHPGDPLRKLQAILERSKTHDPYNLRLLASEKADTDKQDYKEGLTRLQQIIPDKADYFIKLAKAYYKAARDAESGNWFDDKESILRKCDKHPPHKNRIKHRLLSGLFNVRLSPQMAKDLPDLMKKTKAEKSQLNKICESAADLIKKQGATFRLLYDRVSLDAKVKDEEKEIQQLKKKILQAGPKLGDILEKLTGQKVNGQRYSDPYILSQIHNIYTDRHGFNKTCRECTNDNTWRMEDFGPQTDEPITSARARRLPSDAGRPFDGFLRRLIEVQAHKIAQAKVKQIKSDTIIPDVIHIPIILEENEFTFTESLYDLKGISKKSDKFKRIAKGIEFQEQQWKDKNQRIHEDSKGICPYTGKKLDGKGQIDHIIPRAGTYKFHATAYNCEANLIYCTTTGNVQKQDKRYNLSDLNSDYLHNQFGTTDISSIEETIRPTFEQARHDPRMLTRFYQLTPEVRRNLRHAIFCPSIYGEMVNMLNQQRKTRVNGTQRYLGKLIASILSRTLREEFPAIKVNTRVMRVPAERIHELRQELTGIDDRYTKEDKQSAFSHVVDAALAHVAAMEDDDMAEFSNQSLEHWKNSGLSLEGQMALPAQLVVAKIESKTKLDFSKPGPRVGKSIFKDTIYAERYLPFMILPDGELAFGCGMHHKEHIKLIPGGTKKSQIPTDVVHDLLTPFLKNKTNLENLRESARQSGKTIFIGIDRQAVHQLEDRIATQTCDNKEIQQFELLHSIRYFTQKRNVYKQITTDKGTICERDLLIDNIQKDCTKKFAISCDKKKSIRTQTNSILLPVFWQWKRFIRKTNIEAFREQFAIVANKKNELKNDKKTAKSDEQKAKLDDQIEECNTQNQNINDSYEQAIRDYFLNSNSANQAHHPVRKMFSLPYPDAPSGGFRIHRRGMFESAWQVHATEGLANQGFAVIDGRIDFSKEVSLDILRKSKSVHSVDEKYDPSLDHCICGFDEWRAIDIPQELNWIEKLWIKPNSKARPAIRILCSFNAYQTHVMRNTEEKSTHYFNYPTDCKVKGKILSDLQTPRDSLSLLMIGDTIQFQYIASGWKELLKQLYQDAYTRDMNRDSVS